MVAPSQNDRITFIFLKDFVFLTEKRTFNFNLYEFLLYSQQIVQRIAYRMIAAPSLENNLIKASVVGRLSAIFTDLLMKRQDVEDIFFGDFTTTTDFVKILRDVLMQEAGEQPVLKYLEKVFETFGDDQTITMLSISTSVKMLICGELEDEEEYLNIF